jgi:FkbM family methyltransferase
MALSDYVYGYLKYLNRKNPINAILSFRMRFRNYLTVLKHYRMNRYPFSAVLKNGEVKTINSLNQLRALLMGAQYDIEKDVITLRDGITFVNGVTNGDVHGTYIQEVYKSLPVKDRVVVDIGANIGDSAIYFSKRGARSVIAIEPSEVNYQLAKQNIVLNAINNIQLVHAACTSSGGYINIDSNIGGVFTSVDRTGNIKVKSVTLQDIVNEFNLSDQGILKMDCEGSEYDIIGTSSDATLRMFSHVQIEYHYGCRHLKAKFERLGFKVTADHPTYSSNGMYFGWLHAHLI